MSQRIPEYLNENFDPKTLTIPQIRSILRNHDVKDVPAPNQPKRIFLKLFKTEIADHRDEYIAQFNKTNGFTDSANMADEQRKKGRPKSKSVDRLKTPDMPKAIRGRSESPTPTVTLEKEEIIPRRKSVSPIPTEKKTVLFEKESISLERKPDLSEEKIVVSSEKKEILSEDKQVLSKKTLASSEIKATLPDKKSLLSEKRPILPEKKFIDSLEGSQLTHTSIKPTTPEKKPIQINTNNNRTGPIIAQIKGKLESPTKTINPTIIKNNFNLLNSGIKSGSVKRTRKKFMGEDDTKTTNEELVKKPIQKGRRRYTNSILPIHDDTSPPPSKRRKSYDDNTNLVNNNIFQRSSFLSSNNDNEKNEPPRIPEANIILAEYDDDEDDEDYVYKSENDDDLSMETDNEEEQEEEMEDDIMNDEDVRNTSFLLQQQEQEQQPKQPQPLQQKYEKKQTFEQNSNKKTPIKNGYSVSPTVPKLVYMDTSTTQQKVKLVVKNSQSSSPKIIKSESEEAKESSGFSKKFNSFFKNKFSGVTNSTINTTSPSKSPKIKTTNYSPLKTDKEKTMENNIYKASSAPVTVATNTVTSSFPSSVLMSNMKDDVIGDIYTPLDTDSTKDEINEYDGEEEEEEEAFRNINIPWTKLIIFSAFLSMCTMCGLFIHWYISTGGFKGYCTSDIDTTGNYLNGIPKDDWRQYHPFYRYLPTCLPCPENAVCSSEHVLYCSNKNDKKQPGLLSKILPKKLLIFPLNEPVCKLDVEKIKNEERNQRAVHKLMDISIQVIREYMGDKKCSEIKNDQNIPKKLNKMTMTEEEKKKNNEIKTKTDHTTDKIRGIDRTNSVTEEDKPLAQEKKDQIKLTEKSISDKDIIKEKSRGITESLLKDLLYQRIKARISEDRYKKLWSMMIKQLVKASDTTSKSEEGEDKKTSRKKNTQELTSDDKTFAEVLKKLKYIEGAGEISKEPTSTTPESRIKENNLHEGIIYTTESPIYSMKCQIKWAYTYYIRQPAIYVAHRLWKMASIFMVFSVTTMILSNIVQRRHRRQIIINNICEEVIWLLQEAVIQNKNDPLHFPSPNISVAQLYDILLPTVIGARDQDVPDGECVEVHDDINEESSTHYWVFRNKKERDLIWRKVYQKIQFNSNVLESNALVRSESHRCWEWIGNPALIVRRKSPNSCYYTSIAPMNLNPIKETYPLISMYEDEKRRSSLRGDEKERRRSNIRRDSLNQSRSYGPFSNIYAFSAANAAVSEPVASEPLSETVSEPVFPVVVESPKKKSKTQTFTTNLKSHLSRLAVFKNEKKDRIEKEENKNEDEEVVEKEVTTTKEEKKEMKKETWGTSPTKKEFLNSSTTTTTTTTSSLYPTI